MTLPRSPARERSWTLRRRLGASFAALAVLLFALVAALVISTVLFVNAGNKVIYRWQPAISAGQSLLTDLVDQETGVRGYVLTGDPTFLEPYNQYLVAERADTSRLRNLLGNDAGLQTRFAAVKSAIGTWHKQVASTAIAAIEAGGGEGTAIVDSPEGKRHFDEIRARSADLAVAIQSRTEQARNARTTYGFIFVAALSVALGVLLLAGGTLWRGLHRWVLGPVDRLGAQTRRVSSGETNLAIVADGPLELTGLGRDVDTMRRQIASQLAVAERAQEELRVRSEELARSNDDLQQFAYVASHDLSEPLRKVANFCQLLERQYGPELDDRARQYIDFAVDGAKRLQILITDLLALSRVGRTTERFVPVDLDAAFDQAVANLGDNVGGDARIERATPLPTVPGDRSLLTSLLENLIGNAVKYRREHVAPIVTVSAERDDHEWTFTVADNGIGIDQEYAERIFVVFQRLHLRDQYGGTGIGLALCRKIVEFHGGQIWLADVESVPVAGATFRFTLPEGGDLAQHGD